MATYYFPPRRDDPSYSTLAGFNNTVAIAAVLAGAAMLTVLRWWMLRPSDRDPMEGTESTAMPWWPLALLCVVQSAITLALLVLTDGHTPTGEAHYLLLGVSEGKYGIYIRGDGGDFISRGQAGRPTPR